MPVSVRLVACLAFLLAAPAAQTQTTGTLEGRVTEAGTGTPVPGATVLVEGTQYGTAADPDGRYRLRLPAGRYPFEARAVGYVTQRDTLEVPRGGTLQRDWSLEVSTEEMEGAVVEGDRGAEDAGVFTIAPEDARNMPTPLPDGLQALAVLPGVTTSNETSSAFSVRGGSYNENLFFLNGFEVYRPFRTQQGEQEGLSFLNADLASRITLYAGGFPARYGGKLASAVDVAYGLPEAGITGTAGLSALDATAALRAVSRDGRFGVSVGARNAQAGQFFATQELKGRYEPSFQDVQLLARASLAEGHNVELLGIYARNQFELEPVSRRTTFGVFPTFTTASFRFEGTERDGYALGFGGVRVTNRITDALRAEHRAAYFTIEETEAFDISGSVFISEIRDPNGNPDAPSNRIRLGSAVQRDFADNRVEVTTLTAGGRYTLALGRHAAEAGWTVRRLAFADRILEGTTLQGRDSNGERVEVEVAGVAGTADTTATQLGFYVQDSFDVLGSQPGRLILTAGVRTDYFSFNDEWTVGPRLSLRYQAQENMALTAAAGVYHQAPTYQELRGQPLPGERLLDALNDDLKSQRSLQGVVGVERFFPSVRFWGRAEAYYKRLSNLISFDVDNVRVEYSGENDSDGYAYGVDLQIRGEFVPGLESWLNYGFLVARETFRDPFVTPLSTGTLARPTDRRHNFSAFVQDFVPGSDVWRIHLRALFGTGLPYTAPDPGETVGGVQLTVPGARNAARYPSYARFDIGASRTLVLTENGPGGRPLQFLLTAELLNVFDMANTITYSYITSGGQFERIPTRLTPRTVNLRMRVDF